MIKQTQIIQWLKQGDKRAISYLYDHYSASLYGLLMQMLKNEALAQDALQEVFIKVWKNSNSYDPQKGSLFTWLVRITRNTAINKLQSKTYRNSQKNQSLQNLVSHHEDSTLIQQINVNKIGLMGLVNKLEEKYRTVIDLAYFQGYTQKEIEEELGIPIGTVKSRIRIALRKLRVIFEYERNAIGIIFFSLLNNI